jgi:methyltransferase-like protein/trans-aconitate methyltransferase
VDEAVDVVRAEYDAVPYESLAFPQSAPGHLAAIAHLLGLDVPDVSTARVLEIGCSSGGNLVPFAAQHPEARAVGIDLSQVHVDQGRQKVTALDLDNLELLQGDIAEIDLNARAPFDFVICHGVYSWVPDSVQDAILATTKSLLAPEGIAYISYNTYPGWKAKEIVRDAMLMRGGARGNPAEKLLFARGMIDFLEGVAQPDSVLSKALADFKETASTTQDYYLLHEYLETFNQPCYFLEMLQRAGDQGLGYLAEALPHIMFPAMYGPDVAGPLLEECGHSQVLVEQYLDFVVNRTFRQTLFVHADRAPQIQYRLNHDRYRHMHFAAQMPPLGEVSRFDDSRQEYGQRPGFTMFAEDPKLKAALDVFNSHWPWTLSRQDLIDAVQKRLAEVGIEVETSGDLETTVDGLLDFLIVYGQTSFRLKPVLGPSTSGPLCLDETARRMAELSRNDVTAFTFNAWHEPLVLSPIDRDVLPLLDGTRGRDELIEAVLEFARATNVVVERDGRTLTDAAEHREFAAAFVDELPQRLAQMKLIRTPEFS